MASCVGERLSSRQLFPFKKVTPAMVMDEMFSLALSDLPLGDTEQVFGFESDISTKSMDSIIPVDLAPLNMEELEFDFEDMEDFGPWIETNVTSDGVEPEPSKPQLSDRLNLKDLEMSEAVRYDCMWSSYNSFNADKSVSVKSRNPSSSSLNLSNSFYDSLLNSFETPSCTDSDSHDVSDCKVSDMDTDDSDSDTISSEQQKSYTKEKSTPTNNANDISSVKLFASLDHCYNISSTQLDNDKFINSSGPLTPPMSSDDEDSQGSPTNFKCEPQLASQTNKHQTFIRTKSSNRAQSLLKKSVTKQNEAKFSIKVNMKADNKSRSLLKQKSQKVKIIKAPFKADGSQQIKSRHSDSPRMKSSQSAMRKRKERSLKMQEGEARQIHNQMERQRRNELKVSFDKLKTVLPELAASDKASKQQILDKAVDTVQMIKSTELSLMNRRNSLNKSNALLKDKLRKLKEELKISEPSKLGIGDW